MGQLWATIAGINHYQFFQPLPYARQDAAALYEFLSRYRDLHPTRGRLLTDQVHPSQQNPVTHPTREAWWLELQEMCRTDQLQPEDVLWVFFSGYGVHQAGDDYLMPWDGNPQAIETTGIPVRSLFQLLHGARTQRILVFLDMSRSQGIFAPEQRPGLQTAELADQFGIHLLLSCEPHQFAHETMDLHLGLFTAALLEGLRSQRIENWGELALYLGDRVPELCHQHWKPPQVPLGVGTAIFDLYPARITSPVPVASSPSSLPQPLLPNLPLPTPPVKSQFRPPEASFTPRFPDASVERSDRIGFWGWFTIALVTFGGIGLVVRFTPGRSDLIPTHHSVHAELSGDGTAEHLFEEPSAESPSTLLEANQIILRQARDRIRSQSASQFSEAIALARQIQPGDPLYDQAQADIDRWSNIVFDLALGRAAAGNYLGAIEAANLVPTDRENYTEAQAAIEYWETQIN